MNRNKNQEILKFRTEHDTIITVLRPFLLQDSFYYVANRDRFSFKLDVVP